MKSSILFFMGIASMVMATLNDLTVPSSTIFARSPLLIDVNNLLLDTSNILRRSGQPPPPAKVFSPAILRAQDAAAASNRKSANVATQRATNSPTNSPTSSPHSPPTSPRTTEHRADLAERLAAQARTNFHTVNQENARRANHVAQASSSIRPHDDFINKLTFAEWQNVAADAKAEQASAYTHAANAARKAGRQERYIRNSQKAAASEALARSHYASVDVTRTTAIHQFGQLEHAARLASNPNPPGGETSLPSFRGLQQSRDLMEVARSTKTDAAREAIFLRDFGAGKDTQSSSSSFSDSG